MPVRAGDLYKGNYINVKAPSSDGWLLLESSPAGIVFGRDSNTSHESFVALILMFDLPLTNSPKEFENLIIQVAGRDLETDRFTTKDFSHKYSETRGYPCVDIHNVSTDRKAQTSTNNTAILTLENKYLYCRHPVRTNTGFAIGYSHRGETLHPNFMNEALDFIKGVQVPDSQPTQPEQ